MYMYMYMVCIPLLVFVPIIPPVSAVSPLLITLQAREFRGLIEPPKFTRTAHHSITWLSQAMGVKGCV